MNLIYSYHYHVRNAPKIMRVNAITLPYRLLSAALVSSSVGGIEGEADGRKLGCPLGTRGCGTDDVGDGDAGILDVAEGLNDGEKDGDFVGEYEWIGLFVS